jgi:hypothetical protein
MSISNQVSAESSLDLINIRNNFYFHSYRGIIVANILVVVLLGLIIGFFKYQKNLTSGPRYFPTTADGSMIDMPPLNVNHLKLSKLLVDNKGFLIDQPKINVNTLSQDRDNALVLYWTKKAVFKMFDYDYVNYRSTLEELRNYFVPGGHELFMKALNESKNMESIKASKRVVRASIVEEPVVKRIGLMSNRYAWQIFLPVDIYYENITDEPLIQKIIAKMWVVRVSTLQSPFFGLAIVIINLEPRS